MKTENTHNRHRYLHSDAALLQLIRYAIVGTMNTLLTLAVIFICKSIIGINPYVSNAIGYFVGLINSFIWNRWWVFHATDHGRIHHQAARFLLGFFICYGIQLLVVWLLNKSSFGDIMVSVMGITLSGYGIATLIGNVVYTGCNFIYNRVIAFKK